LWSWLKRGSVPPKPNVPRGWISSVIGSSTKRGAAVLQELEAMDLRGRSKSAREAHREHTQYFRNHQHRMDYPRYVKNGWQIGSGPIEAACKTVIAERLKCSGIRWGEDGADAVSHLRALWLSEPSQWESLALACLGTNLTPNTIESKCQRRIARTEPLEVGASVRRCRIDEAP
jgi:hypothetical protein